jgi:hypothetical protein
VGGGDRAGEDYGGAAGADEIEGGAVAGGCESAHRERTIDDGVDAAGGGGVEDIGERGVRRIVGDLEYGEARIGEGAAGGFEVAGAGSDAGDAERAGVLPGAGHVVTGEGGGGGLVQLEDVDAAETIDAAIETATEGVVCVVGVGFVRGGVPMLAHLGGDRDFGGE